ncbi:MAG: 50S ribosomal protein L44e, partial [Candidatus Nitrosopelagicus sp.]|nr:50S ribosomal protein L44e [Candidatus Nitrosopelagicus sp.]
KTTKKVTLVETCTTCKKKMMKKGIRIRKFELIAV